MTLSANGRHYMEVLEIERDPTRGGTDAATEEQYEFDQAWYGTDDDQ